MSQFSGTPAVMWLAVCALEGLNSRVIQSADVSWLTKGERASEMNARSAAGEVDLNENSIPRT